jgi:hypothetical protein
MIVIVAATAGYGQWHYEQHDNRFCATCHLTQHDLDRFASSAHARLECRACHQATVDRRLHLMYAAAVHLRTGVADHAVVPSRVCEDCHIPRDSTRWKIVAKTAGHRKHLESNDPRLRGMRCTTCHGISLHAFAPVALSCAQAACHAGTTIVLGTMGGVTELHCTACHNYLADARTVAFDTLNRPLTPAAKPCVACHTMQQRLASLDIGLEPHRGVCGDCHNPHQHPGSPVSCTQASCHANWRSVSFHVGARRAARCITCHEAHSWRAPGAGTRKAAGSLARPRRLSPHA